MKIEKPGVGKPLLGPAKNPVSRVMRHMSRVTFLLSCVMCHISRVACHLSPVAIHQQPQSLTLPLLTSPLITVDWFAKTQTPNQIKKKSIDGRCNLVKIQKFKKNFKISRTKI